MNLAVSSYASRPFKSVLFVEYIWADTARKQKSKAAKCLGKADANRLKCFRRARKTQSSDDEFIATLLCNDSRFGHRVLPYYSAQCRDYFSDLLKVEFPGVRRILNIYSGCCGPDWCDPCLGPPLSFQSFITAFTLSPFKPVITC